MIRITKKFDFEAGHALYGYDGKCKNLHGHTYRLQVEVTGELHATGPKAGMVMDYGDLKAMVNRHIIEPMDHAFIYDTTSARECRLAATLRELDSKQYGLPLRTTAENIAQHIYRTLRGHGLPVSLIRLWETPTSYAEYYE